MILIPGPRLSQSFAHTKSGGVVEAGGEDKASQDALIHSINIVPYNLHWNLYRRIRLTCLHPSCHPIQIM